MFTSKFPSTVLLLVCCIGCSVTAGRHTTAATGAGSDPQRIPHAPPFREVTEIVVTSKRWEVRIWKDGNGCLGGGQLLSEGAVFPTNTFNFRKVHKSVLYPVRNTRTGGDKFMVSFDTTTSGGYLVGFDTWDAKTVHQIFKTAKQHCVPSDVEHFEKVWKEMPPFSK